MVKNSISFNGNDNPYTKTGITIRKEILKVLNCNEEVLKKFDPKISEESAHKREKRVSKKKDLDEGFVVPEVSYGLRGNQRTSRLKYC